MQVWYLRRSDSRTRSKTRRLSVTSPAASMQDPCTIRPIRSLTPLGSHTLNSSCGLGGSSSKVSNPEVSNPDTYLTMALAQRVLSIFLEKYGIDIVAHSLRYAPGRRPLVTTFDVEYTKAHRLEVQAIRASEILNTDLLLNALEADSARPTCYQ